MADSPVGPSVDGQREGEISRALRLDMPFLGVGVGLRPCHYPEILRRLGEEAPAGSGSGGAHAEARASSPGTSEFETAQLGTSDLGTPDLGLDWFELLSENYMIRGGRPLRVLQQLREHVPLVLHGVSLNIGSTDPLDGEYLDELSRLAEFSSARWISDHLCWTGVGSHNTHDLIPLPYTSEAVDHVVERVRQVQLQLGRRIALENVSSYLSYTADAMPEWEFLATIAEDADCAILLDVNNVFVSAHNHGFDASEYIAGIPPERVCQIHLAGHSESGPLLIDTHDHPVRDEVWELYEQALRRIGPVSTLIEWDDRVPPYGELLGEVRRAKAILESVWPKPLTQSTRPATPA